MPDMEQEEFRAAVYERLVRIAIGFRASAWLTVVAKLRVADHLKDGPRTGEELAAAVGAKAIPLTSVLRGLTGLDVFRQDEDGRFALTPMSELLRSDVPWSTRGMILWLTETSYQVYASLLHTVQTGEPAFEHVMGMPVYEYRSKNEEVEVTLGANSSRILTAGLVSILASYDFSGLKHIVDVGGGRGALLAALMGAVPHTSGVLIEREKNVEEARRHFESQGLAGRCQAVVGDIFQAVPEGGDCYIMSRLISNFTDDRALKILENTSRAMAPRGRVIVIDQLMPSRITGSGVPYAVELDINSQAHLGGRVRTEREFRDLFERAGLRLTRLSPVEPTRYDYFVIEAQRAS